MIRRNAFVAIAIAALVANTASAVSQTPSHANSVEAEARAQGLLPLQLVAQQALATGRMHPSGFGGVAFADDGRTLDAFVVRGDQSLANTLHSILDDFGQVRTVDNSYSALIETRNAVGVDHKWFEGIGLELTSWGPDVRSNSIVANVHDFTPAQQEAERERYGSLVQLRDSGEMLRPIASRWDDSQPWNAGNTINMYENGQFASVCTSGPSIRNPSSGNKYTLVPAHCSFNQNFRNWYNGLPFSSTPGNFVGQTFYINTEDFNTDSALIASNTSTLVWRWGTVRWHQRAHVANIDTESGICVSGSLSGEICGGTIVAVDQCAFVEYSQGQFRIACELVVVQNDGEALAGAGDSGGPVYSVRPQNDGLNMRGMMNLIDTSPEHTRSCPFWPDAGGPGSRSICSDKVFYTDLTHLLGQYGGVLNVP